MKGLLKTISLALCLGALPVYGQSTYPNKPIRLICGFAPGGGSDTLARALSQPLSELLGQQVAVDNRLGAGGIIAAEVGAKAAPDGYTWLVGSAAAFGINPNLMSKLPYDPVKDFAPVGLYATFSYALDVHPSLPVRSVKDLIAFAKARPGQIYYGSAGNGTSTHIATEQFLMQAGIKIIHVPYKGNTPAMTALMSGEVAMVLDPVLTTAPHAKSGRIRALGVTTLKRSALLPDIPTIDESGLKGYEAGNWQAIFVPAGTPRAVIERLNKAINAVVNRPEMKERLFRQGAEPLTGSPEDLGNLVNSELAKFSKIIKEAHLRAE